MGTDEDLFALARLKSRDELNSFTKREEPNLGEEPVNDSDSDSGDPGDAFLYGRDKYDEETEAMLDAQYTEYIERSKGLQKALLKRNSESSDPAMTLEMM